MSLENDKSSPVDHIPPPDAVRERLATSTRECRLLRSLLKVSLKAAEERQRIETAEGPQGA